MTYVFSMQRIALLVSFITLGTGASAAAQTPVRVAAWNIQRVGAPATTEYDAALAVLQRLGADVVGFNEIASSSDALNFEALAADAGYPFVVVADSSSFPGPRNGLMSRYPIIDARSQTSPVLSGDGAANDQTRLILRVTVDVPGNAQDLTLLVQHWKSGTTNADEFRRGVESIRIAQSLSDLDPLATSYVVLGDINDELDSVPNNPNLFTALPSGLPVSYQLGADVQSTLASNGIVNNPFEALTQMSGPQLAVVDALRLNGLDETRPASGRRLDYVLASPSLVAGGISSETYSSRDDALYDGLAKFGAPLPFDTSLDASDHLPVVADMVVPLGSCTADVDCDDGLFCNGIEQCIAGICQAGTTACTGATCDETADQCVTQTALAWINEFHYDNAGTDADEGVEVAGPAGLDLTGWQLVGYNGNGSVVYDTQSLTGSLPDQQAGLGTLWFSFVGLQNGNDGVALVDPTGFVHDFIAYEGPLTAVDGPAAGMTAPDIGVAEDFTTPIGQSLQREGVGFSAGAFQWVGPQAWSRGAPNAAQTFTQACTIDADCDDGAFCNGQETCDITKGCQAGARVVCDDSVACTVDACDEATDACIFSPTDALCSDGVFCNGAETCDAVTGCQVGPVACPTGTCDEANLICAAPSPWINEIHYDNASTDVDEGVEIAGMAGQDLSGWQLVGYNGNGGRVYRTVGLSGVLADESEGFGTRWFAFTGLQNGSPDGLALVDPAGNVVEFWSYEGTLTAVDGPAVGLVSTDMGVAEDFTVAPGLSLQKQGHGRMSADFSWVSPRAHSRGAVNVGQSFGCTDNCLDIPSEGLVAYSWYDWVTVSLSRTYTSAVVVCTPNYGPGDAPLVARVRNVTATSFEVSAYNMNEGILYPNVPLHCMVVEEGVYDRVRYGTALEAARQVSTDTDSAGQWLGMAQSYQNSYVAPVVVGQVMTANDPAFSVFWAHGGDPTQPPSGSGFFIGKHAGEDPFPGRLAETLGYIVTEAGSGELGGRDFHAGVGAEAVRGFDDQPPYLYPVSGIGAPMVGVLTAAGMSNGNGHWPVLYGANPLDGELRLCLDEDQLGDFERSTPAGSVAHILIR